MAVWGKVCGWVVCSVGFGVSCLEIYDRLEKPQNDDANVAVTVGSDSESSATPESSDAVDVEESSDEELYDMLENMRGEPVVEEPSGAFAFGAESSGAVAFGAEPSDAFVIVEDVEEPSDAELYDTVENMRGEPVVEEPSDAELYDTLENMRGEPVVEEPSDAELFDALENMSKGATP